VPVGGGATRDLHLGFDTVMRRVIPGSK
jgi:hypothetical protein